MTSPAFGDGDAARLHIVGLLGGTPYGAEAAAALAAATTVVGSARQLSDASGLLAADAEHLELSGPLDAVSDRIAERLEAGRLVDGRLIVVLASGDPGFFGIVRVLGERFGAQRLAVHPAPSSVSMAFARIGVNWDDAIVASAHGRDLDDALDAAIGHDKVAFLSSPDNPPETIGKGLLERARLEQARLDRGLVDADVAVVSNIGGDDEQVHRIDLEGLASGSFEPMSVVLVLRATTATGTTLAWGRDPEAFVHRDGMITKAEVRAVALGKLELPRAGVVWDLGAGSGSVAVEIASLSPALRVIAVDRDPAQIDRVVANAASHHVQVETVTGSAPEVLDQLPDPDRVFIGGGGIEVLDAVLDRLRPDGVVVATYAVLERAVTACERLGLMTQVAVSRAVPISDLGYRLVGENPVFIAWGPSRPPTEPTESIERAEREGVDL